MEDDDRPDKNPDWQDAPVESYEHRSKDEHGNPDDKLTEKQALKEAKKQGIEFVDEFRLAKVGSGIGANTLPEIYKNQKDADKARKERKDADKYHVVQTRRQARPDEV